MAYVHHLFKPGASKSNLALVKPWKDNKSFSYGLAKPRCIPRSGASTGPAPPLLTAWPW